jgi:uncharacterized glyoxalase superfamily protein PhnB
MTQNVIPVLRYEDCKAAIAWLKETLGFEELSVMKGEGGAIEHAELVIADNVVMMGSTKSSELDDRIVTARCVTYVVVDDPDARAEQAQAAGVELAMELTDQPYGSREFAVTDPEGNTWSLGTYRPKLTPA